MENNHIKILLLFASLLVISCKSSLKTEHKEILKKHKKYIIDGHVPTEVNATKIFLLNRKGVKVDSAEISKNSFSIKGKILSPDSYYLKLNNGNKKHIIVLENSNYKVLINNDKSMIIGGELNSKLSNYYSKKSLYAGQKNHFLNEFQKMKLGLREYLKQADSIRRIEDSLFSKFINDNNHNILSSIVLDKTSLSLKNIRRLKAKVASSDNQELLTKIDNLISNLKIAEAEEKVLRRKPVPLFSGVNLSGRQTHLEKLIKNKKAFLIDFWASWCPPCREASPKLKAIYRKYKHKGFDILTVSEDRSVDEWKSGVFIDDIEDWHHIYDDFNRISSMFSVGPLPHMVLIDENGKIIKNNISMSTLKSELEKIFSEE